MSKTIFLFLLAFSIVSAAADTFIVSNTNNGSTGSLRKAINDANANPGSDIITFATVPFAVSQQTIQLAGGGDIPITDALTLLTPDVGLVIDAQGNDRIFEITGSGTDGVHLKNLILSNGNPGAGADGGGIRIAGSSVEVTLENCVVTNCEAFGHGGGIYIDDASVTILDSSITDNDAGIARAGGGIYVTGTAAELFLLQSTIAGNEAGTDGGGLYVNRGSATLLNSTVTENTAGGIGGGIVRNSTSSVQLHNSIVAENIDSDPTLSHTDLSGHFDLDSANNLIGIGEGSTTFDGNNGVNGNIIGTLAAPIDPVLGARANNGGLTETYRPRLASPARDAGDNTVLQRSEWPAIPTYDQRGQFRVLNGTIDIGATESPVPTIVTIEAIDPVASEFQQKPAVIRLTRSATDLSLPLTVELELDPSSEANANDFFNGSTTFTFVIDAGMATAEVDIIPVDNDGGTEDWNERATLNIVDLPAYALDTVLPTSASINIIEDDMLVTNGSDDGINTLRKAIELANIGGGASIAITPGLDIRLESAALLVESEIVLDGNGITIDACGNFIGILDIQNTGEFGTAEFKNLTLSGAGGNNLGGAVVVVSSRATAIFSDVIIRDNAMQIGLATINSDGDLSLHRCAITDNHGGITAFSGTFLAVNTTISRNTYHFENALFLDSQVKGRLYNCTITENQATFEDAYAVRPVTDLPGSLSKLFYNTVIANNASLGIPLDLDADGTQTGLSHCFIGVGSSQALSANGINGSIVGDAATPADPKIGGGNLHFIPAHGSPLIDAGTDFHVAAPPFLDATIDAVGRPRLNGTVDIGAVETHFFVVENTSGSGSNSLAAELLAANASPHGGIIVFDASLGFDSPQTIPVGTTTMEIDGNVTILGPDAPGRVTIDAGNSDRLFIQESGAAEIINLTLKNGSPSSGDGGVIEATDGESLAFVNCTLRDSNSPGSGGAIDAHIPLTLRLCRVINNQSDSQGGAVRALSASFFIDTLFRGNTTTGSHAGAIGGPVTNAPVLVNRCTFTKNTATQFGGAIRFHAGHTQIVNSTFSGNLAINGSAIDTGNSLAVLRHVTITENHGGAALRTSDGSPIRIQDSIIAANSSAIGQSPDIQEGFVLASAGNNLIGVLWEPLIPHLQPSDLYGSAASPLNPLLAPLADNGGPTPTHALYLGSPALDAASLFRPYIDQRGTFRYQTFLEIIPDIGAYEATDPDYIPFERWADLTIPAGLSAGATDDPDCDGISNGIEFFTGSNPNSATSTPNLEFELLSGKAVFTFPVASYADPTAAVVEWSTDLENWDDTGIEYQTPDASTRQGVYLGEAPRVFLRLKY